MDEQIYQQQVNQQQIWITVPNEEEPKQWLAIASFVLSLLGFNILWLIFWIIALNKKQLRRAAMAGTIISAIKLFFIVLILPAAIIPRIWAARDKANDVAREYNVKSLATAMMTYSMDDNGYPNSIANLDLTKYSIPVGNFNGNPTYDDTYNYLQLDNWSHFVIYTNLSCEDCGNCDSDVVSKMTDYNSVANYIWNSTWGSFCVAN